MSTETMRVQLTQLDLVTLINRHSARGENVSLVDMDDTVRGRMVSGSTLTLHVNGNQTATQVILNADGTWNATTHITIGDW